MEPNFHLIHEKLTILAQRLVTIADKVHNSDPSLSTIDCLRVLQSWIEKTHKLTSEVIGRTAAVKPLELRIDALTKDIERLNGRLTIEIRRSTDDMSSLRNEHAGHDQDGTTEHNNAINDLKSRVQSLVSEVARLKKIEPSVTTLKQTALAQADEIKLLKEKLDAEEERRRSLIASYNKQIQSQARKTGDQLAVEMNHHGDTTRLYNASLEANQLVERTLEEERQIHAGVIIERNSLRDELRDENNTYAEVIEDRYSLRGVLQEELDAHALTVKQRDSLEIALRKEVIAHGKTTQTKEVLDNALWELGEDTTNIADLQEAYRNKFDVLKTRLNTEWESRRQSAAEKYRMSIEAEQQKSSTSFQNQKKDYEELLKSEQQRSSTSLTEQKKKYGGQLKIEVEKHRNSLQAEQQTLSTSLDNQKKEYEKSLKSGQQNSSTSLAEQKKEYEGRLKIEAEKHRNSRQAERQSSSTSLENLQKEFYGLLSTKNKEHVEAREWERTANESKNSEIGTNVKAAKDLNDANKQLADSRKVVTDLTTERRSLQTELEATQDIKTERDELRKQVAFFREWNGHLQVYGDIWKLTMDQTGIYDAHTIEEMGLSLNAINDFRKALQLKNIRTQPESTLNIFGISDVQTGQPIPPNTVCTLFGRIHTKNFRIALPTIDAIGRMLQTSSKRSRHLNLVFLYTFLSKRCSMIQGNRESCSLATSLII
jgi:hypothetical protein